MSGRCDHPDAGSSGVTAAFDPDESWRQSVGIPGQTSQGAARPEALPPTREALAVVNHDWNTPSNKPGPKRKSEPNQMEFRLADFLLASGVLGDPGAAEAHDNRVRAEALEAFADEIGPWTLASETSNVARARAAEYRKEPDHG